ncbi:MAG: (d)CMP kinase [Chromatiales bacterium]|nr:(d)CMP kinase [Chromatiales bacterium]
MTDTPPPVLTIDGPSGSGKGTIARRLARELGWHYLDSGAVYRALGLAVERRGLDPDDAQAVVETARGLALRFRPADRPEDDCVDLDGVDVSAALRGEACAALASRVAALGPVRAALLERQRGFRMAPGLVADGRDMGTTVFPDATLKVFLTASAEARAGRRYKQLKEKGIEVTIASLAREIAERDRRDAGRSASPLKAADDAVVIDSTDLSIDSVTATVRAKLHERLTSAA